MIATGFLDVGNGHQIRWETHGNPNGIPVAFLHGGPGSGFQPYHPGLFDLDKVFLILHDQRGCGDSRFTQQLNGNTTEALLADIEALRKHFGLEKWWICGHSWGATLAVLYAAQHSTQCLGAIPVSSFLARREDTFTLFRNLEAKYPEQWRAFTALLGNDIAASMSACLAGGDAEKRNTLLSLYAAMEGSVADFEKAWRRGNVYWHYIANDFFMADGIAAEAARIPSSVPLHLLHGTNDIECPLYHAETLKTLIPHATLRTAAGAGHSLKDPELQAAARRLLAEVL